MIFFLISLKRETTTHVRKTRHPKACEIGECEGTGKCFAKLVRHWRNTHGFSDEQIQTIKEQRRSEANRKSHPLKVCPKCKKSLSALGRHLTNQHGIAAGTAEYSRLLRRAQARDVPVAEQ